MSTVIIHDFVPYFPPAFIPTPTEEDNGKYIGVSEGVYDLSFVKSLPEGSENQILTYKNNMWKSEINGNSNVNRCVAEVEVYGQSDIDVTVNTQLYPNFKAICNAIDSGIECGMIKIWDDRDSHYLKNTEIYLPFSCMLEEEQGKIYFWNFVVKDSRGSYPKGYFSYDTKTNKYSYVLTT